MMKQDIGGDSTDEETTLAILREFYPNDSREWTKCILEFNSLVTEPYKYNIKLDLDFENKPAEYYIVADTYVKNADLVALYNHLSGHNKTDLSVQFAIKVKNMFLESVSHFKEKYEWIYNPPMMPGINKHTVGRMMRQEFQEHYGSYAEITYLLAKGDAMKFDEVNKMKLSDYLALGEYLLRKRTVEAVE